MIYPKAFIDDDSLINIFQKSCLPVFFKDVSNINNVGIVIAYTYRLVKTKTFDIKGDSLWGMIYRRQRLRKK
jgi:hypothetical protein